jgi:hypothetical protein
VRVYPCILWVGAKRMGTIPMFSIDSRGAESTYDRSGWGTELMSGLLAERTNPSTPGMNAV